MKNETITKINKIGNVGQIIAKIAKVVISIGAIACLVAGIILLVMPDDMLTIHMEGKAAVEINMPIVDGQLVMNTGDGPTVIVGSVSTEGSLELNGMEYGIVDITSTENGYMMNAETDKYTLTLNQLTSVVFIAVVNCTAMWVVMHFVEKLCKIFKECETPFTEEVVQTLKKVAIALIPMAFVSNLTTSLTNSIMSGNVNIVIGVDMTTVLLVLIIFMLAAIFSYGTVLQQEADETL